jgi:hypothetical protein
MIRFLVKSWIYPFYRTYAGFLFVVFLLAAGLLKGEEHVAIARFFTSDLSNLLYPFFGFLLYELLTMRFSVLWISLQRNRILQDLLFVSMELRIAYLIVAVLYLQLPVLLYSFFLISMAFATGQYIIGLIILLLTIIKTLIYSLVLNKYCIHPVEKRYNQLVQFYLPDNLNYPVVMFSLRHFFSKNFLSLLLSKLLSIGLLMIFILLIETVENYDRFSAVVVPLTFISNAFISYELFKFINIDLAIFRNLPLRPGITLFQVFIVLFILCLPEVVIIYRNFHDVITLGSLSIHMLNGLSILLFLYAYQVYFNFDLQKYITHLFWGSIILVLILLFDLPSVFLCLLFCSISIYLYSRGYYTFETLYDHRKQ